MAVINDFAGKAAQPVRTRSFGPEVFHTIGLAVSALAAGWNAASDYKHMSTRSDQQLRGMGLSRDRLPDEIYRRHFSKLGNGTDL